MTHLTAYLEQIKNLWVLVTRWITSTELEMMQLNHETKTKLLQYAKSGAAASDTTSSTSSFQKRGSSGSNTSQPLPKKPRTQNPAAQSSTQINTTSGKSAHPVVVPPSGSSVKPKCNHCGTTHNAKSTNKPGWVCPYKKWNHSHHNPDATLLWHQSQYAPAYASHPWDNELKDNKGVVTKVVQMTSLPYDKQLNMTTHKYEDYKLKPCKSSPIHEFLCNITNDNDILLPFFNLTILPSSINTDRKRSKIKESIKTESALVDTGATLRILSVRMRKRGWS